MRIQLYPYYFLLAALLLSCSIDEETAQTEDSLLEFNIYRGNSDFYSFGTVGEVPFRAIVTGSQGEVLANESIEKNTTTVFSINYDPTTDYMVHLAYRENFEDLNGLQSVRYRISTFINPGISDYTINGDSQKNAFGSNFLEPNTTLRVVNVGEPLQSFGYSFKHGTGSSFGNGDFVSLFLPESFSNGFLIRARKENEENGRFNLVPNVMAGDDIDIDYNLMSSSTNHSITGNNRLRVSGLNQNNLDTSYRIFGVENPDHQNLFDFNIPVGIFEKFLVSSFNEVEVSNGLEERLNRTSYSSIESLPTSEVLSPLLTATLQSNIINNFEMQSEGIYDYFRVFFSYAEPQSPDEINNDVIWSIIGDASTEVSFEVPDILSLIINPEDDFQVTLLDLVGGNPLLYNSDEINSTQDYINLIMDRQESPSFRTITYNSFRLRLD